MEERICEKAEFAVCYLLFYLLYLVIQHFYCQSVIKIQFSSVQRSGDRRDIRRFRTFNHSMCKTVLNLLEAVYLRFRKIVVERVTVVKLRVNNRCSDGTGCFRIEVRTEWSSRI